LTVTIPLVVLVAVVAFIAWRFMGLRMWQLILCLLLGFLLAATSAAPEINQIVVGVVHALTGR
jgi:NhaP-type Na+/H+ or K+/H+ antiporter